MSVRRGFKRFQRMSKCFFHVLPSSFSAFDVLKNQSDEWKQSWILQRHVQLPLIFIVGEITRKCFLCMKSHFNNCFCSLVIICTSHSHMKHKTFFYGHAYGCVVDFSYFLPFAWRLSMLSQKCRTTHAKLKNKPHFLSYKQTKLVINQFNQHYSIIMVLMTGSTLRKSCWRLNISTC